MNTSLRTTSRYLAHLVSSDTNLCNHVLSVVRIFWDRNFKVCRACTSNLYNYVRYVSHKILLIFPKPSDLTSQNVKLFYFPVSQCYKRQWCDAGNKLLLMNEEVNVRFSHDNGSYQQSIKRACLWQNIGPQCTTKSFPMVSILKKLSNKR